MPLRQFSFDGRVSSARGGAPQPHLPDTLLFMSCRAPSAGLLSGWSTRCNAPPLWCWRPSRRGYRLWRRHARQRHTIISMLQRHSRLAGPLRHGVGGCCVRDGAGIPRQMATLRGWSRPPWCLRSLRDHGWLYGCGRTPLVGLLKSVLAMPSELFVALCIRLAGEPSSNSSSSAAPRVGHGRMHSHDSFCIAWTADTDSRGSAVLDDDCFAMSTFMHMQFEVFTSSAMTRTRALGIIAVGAAAYALKAESTRHWRAIHWTAAAVGV